MVYLYMQKSDSIQLRHSLNTLNAEVMSVMTNTFYSFTIIMIDLLKEFNAGPPYVLKIFKKF